jgi:hypothetical protein
MRIGTEEKGRTLD